MTAPALTYDEVKALAPCSDDFKRVCKLLGDEREWDGNRIDAATARRLGCTFDDLAWVVSAQAKKDPDVERRVRLFLADCAAHVLHIYESSQNSSAPREMIIAARRYARGEISRDELHEKDARAAEATRAAMDARAAEAAWDARAAEAAWAARAAWATWDAEVAWATRAAWAAGDARDAEREWQFDRLVAWLSDPEPEDWPLPEREARS